MRKILTLILCFLLVLCLAACGGEQLDNNSDNSQSGTTGTEVGGETSGSAQEEKPDSDKGGESGSTNSSGTSDVVAVPQVDGKQLYNRVIKALGNPEVTNDYGSTDNPNGHMFTINSSGIKIRYIGINALKSGDEVNIFHTTDFHFNKMNDRDNAEQNPAVISTRENRSGFRDEATVPNAKNLIALAKRFDAVGITGDNIDYLTWGSLDLVKEHIWDQLGDKVIMPLGGHDATRVMGGKVGDPTSLESRLDILQSAWKHDVHYSNMIVKNRVMLVQLNNGQSKYYGTQAEKLEADIKYARENNLIILIFQHEPIASKYTSAAKVNSIEGKDSVNFYKGNIGGSKFNADATTQKVYDLITQNGDVIRGIFAGHLHINYYVDVAASYVKNGETVKTSIPQIVLAAGSYSKGYGTVINIQ